MENKYKLLDLYCCGGGASKGYHDAGFDVTGVDIVDRSNYPFEFIKANALEILKNEEFIKQFDIITASPPCQRFTKLRYLSNNQESWDKKHPNLITETREWLVYYKNKYNIDYVIENVEGSGLHTPIKLYGSQFTGMLTQRPRLFECSIYLKEPINKKKSMGTGKLNHISETGAVSICGKKPLVGLTEEQTRLYYCMALGGDCQWMSLEELTQCIPPCYTKFIGSQLIDYLNGNQAFNLTDFVQLVKAYL